MHFTSLNTKNTIFKALWTLLFVFTVLPFAKAGTEISTDYKKGSDIVHGTYVQVIDNKVPYIQSGFSNHLVRNVITMAIDHTSNVYIGTAYDNTFGIKIEGEDENGNPIAVDTISLRVQYDPANSSGAYQDKNAYVITGYHKLKATILTIQNTSTSAVILDPADNIIFTADIEIERYYDLNILSIPSHTTLTSNAVDINSDGVKDELVISWPFITGAEEYDLEWTYVNDYGNDSVGTAISNLSTLKYDFKHNATRISTTNQFYSIPLTFERGYILYRVRGVGRTGSEFADHVFGKWTSDNLTTDNLQTFTSTNTTNYYYFNTGHQTKKNWQFSASYAEEGKNKVVISYFDGSLRNRQSVSKMNTDNVAIVGETIYDHQGRSAVQVLPVPVDTAVIKYYNRFNVNAGGTTYSRSDFDLDDTTQCVSSVGTMSPVRGASRYYSPFNPDSLFMNQGYIPDADSIPFTQIEYTPDNTGRIRRQSDVGPNHTLGSGHETQYLYDKPDDQRLLDRLFGPEVGYASHYKRNAVMDANGQASISYLDQQGRVIATALAGDTTANLMPLKNSSGDTLAIVNSFNNVNFDMLNKESDNDVDDTQDNNKLSVDGTSLVYSSELVVYKAGNYTFDYSLEGTKFDPVCLPDSICYNCVYDLEISIKDKCGNPVAGYTPVDVAVGHVSYDCEDSSFTFSYPDSTISVNLSKGSYTVYKKLSVNTDSLDVYFDHYITQQTCVLPIDSFIQPELDSANAASNAGCEITCAECVTSLGDYTDHNDTSKINIDGPNYDPDYVFLTLEEYNESIRECKEPCSYLSPCEASYEQMLQDMSPGGQYGQILNASTYPLSLYNDDNFLPDTTASWRNPNPAYRDINGNLSYIKNSSGTFVTPGDASITLAQFQLKWQSSWAKSLVRYHPEYCYYSWCIDNVDSTRNKTFGALELSSEAFDSLLFDTETFAQVQYLNTTYGIDLLDPLGSSASNSQDPYFGTNGLGFTQYCIMKQKMHESATSCGTTTKSNAFNMWQIAALAASADTNNSSVNCSSVYGDYSAMLTCLNSISGTITDPWDYIDSDLKWENFKMLYYSAKQQLMDKKMDSYARTNKCYNGCIENDKYNPFENGMVTFSFPNILGPFFLSQTPCASFVYPMYSNKLKRFRDRGDMIKGITGISTSNSSYPDSVAFFESDSIMNIVSQLQDKIDCNIYMETGQCPAAIDFVSLLNALAEDTALNNTTGLQGYPQFTQDLYEAVAAPSGNTSYVEYSWTPTITGAYATTLSVGFNPDSCGLTLNFPLINNDPYPHWGYYLQNSSSGFNIIEFKNFVYTGQSGGNYCFTLTAVLDVNFGTDTIWEVPMSGCTCLPVGGCTFPETCAPNVLAIDIQSLLYSLAATGNLTNTTGVNLETTPYNAFFTAQLNNYFLAGNWYWKKTATTTFEIYDNSAGTNKKMVIKFDASPTINYSNIRKFENVRPSSTGGYYVDVVMSDSSVYTLHGNLPTYYTGGTVGDSLSMGNCKSCEPIECELPENHNLVDLNNFLNSFGANIDQDQSLEYNPAFTKLLKAFVISGDQVALWDNVTTSASSQSLTADIVPSDTSIHTKCSFLLEFVDTVNGSYNFTAITSIDHVVADGVNLDGGKSYSFTAVAHFSNGHTELLTGQSCYPIKNCVKCEDEELVTNGAFEFGNTGFYTDRTSFVTNCPSSAPNNKYAITNKYSTICSTLGHDVTTPVGFDATNPANGKFMAFNFTTVHDEDSVGLTLDQSVWKDSVSISANTQYKFSAYYLNATNIYPGGSASPSDYFIKLKINGVVVETKDWENKKGEWKKIEGVWYSDSISGSILIEIVHSVYIANANQNFHEGFGLDNISFITNGCEPVFVRDRNLQEEEEYDDSCGVFLHEVAIVNGTALYEQYIDSVKGDFRKHYIDHCLGNAVETFKRKSPDAEYHYTLYYYDQAGNLVRTVPPQGVVVERDSVDYAQIKGDRSAINDSTDRFMTEHVLSTYYKYNSLNQLIEQTTPDAGTSKFWYDALGRLVLSKNSEQTKVSPFKYSYTKYDALGRITEVGELTTDVFLDTLSQYDIRKYVNALTFPDTISTNKKQITKTIYDTAFASIPGFVQENLRTRVSCSYIDDNGDGSYEHATHYTYDIHGNVKSLIQDNPSISMFGYRYQRVDYIYDLVSGNVKQVAYQKGKKDQYFHKYEYDSDNRITNVYTSKDEVLWDQDAKYFYYKHGPLARVELGNEKVQAVDYAYTLQGWIKGINSNVLNDSLDIGKDGNLKTGNLNSIVARDAYGFSLSYFNDDYKSIRKSKNTVANNFVASVTAAAYLNTDAPELFNGNIKHMITSLTDIDPTNGVTDGTPIPQLTGYKYDQLNRIRQMKAYRDITLSSNAWQNGSGYNANYETKVDYDQNGNILTLHRNGTTLGGSKLGMDHLTYGYFLALNGNIANNRLLGVNDTVNATNYGTDIDHQGFIGGNSASFNYRYDNVGNMIYDKQEKIDTIKWTVYGKVKEVKYQPGSGKKNLEFKYDAQGNMISKIVKNVGFAHTVTNYVRDASGNVLAIYEVNGGSTDGGELLLKENHVYGNRRIGTVERDLHLFETFLNTEDTLSRQLGQKSFHLGDHRDNVNSVVTDKKLPHQNGSSIDYWTSHIIQAVDYGVWGDELPKRNTFANNSRYGFNGMEKLDELNGISGSKYTSYYRGYDARLGRWLSVDPEEGSFPEISPYNNNGNNPIANKDPDGDCPWCIGALIGAGAEIAGQLLSGNSLDEIDWVDVGASALEGAVSGGRKGLTKLVVTASTEVVKAGFDYSKSKGAENVVNGKKDVKEAIVEYTTEKTIGKIVKPIGNQLKKVSDKAVKTADNNLVQTTKKQVKVQKEAVAVLKKEPTNIEALQKAKDAVLKTQNASTQQVTTKAANQVVNNKAVGESVKNTAENIASDNTTDVIFTKDKKTGELYDSNGNRYEKKPGATGYTLVKPEESSGNGSSVQEP